MDSYSKKLLEYLDIGNKAVLEVESSIKVGLMTMILVINRDKYDRLLNYWKLICIKNKMAGNPKLISTFYECTTVQTTFPTPEEIARWQHKLSTMEIVEVTIKRTT